MQTKNPNEEENNRRIYNEIVGIFDFLNLNSITEYIESLAGQKLIEKKLAGLLILAFYERELSNIFVDL